MIQEFNKRFLTDTDKTGRFIVTSLVTGKTYYVEPIDGAYVKWGDVNPATKKIEGSYGEKFKGSIPEEESMITEDNGFCKIETLEPGRSPFYEIDKRDKEYEILAKI